MGKKFKNNSGECGGSEHCDGGTTCWNQTKPTLDLCAKCSCLTCTKGHCPPSDLERQRQGVM